MNKICLTAALLATAVAANAQLSQNPNKFLGNITTYGSVNTDGLEFVSLWDQLTAENESKWSSCEGSRDNFGWGGADRCYNYCQQHGIPYKWHTLAWGGQYPGWMDNLSSTAQLEEFEEWLDGIAYRYPDLEMIDVVNEAIPGHAPAPYRDCLGGDGLTGYDWIIKAFQMAHERWPNAILIYNDFNTFRWQKNEFIDLVTILRDGGAPIDAYGCQSHDLTDMGFDEFKNAMTEIQSKLKMPMYSTEYDIGTDDDQLQLRQYRDQIKYMWEQPYVAGITCWGYIYGKTWTTNGNSGIIRNGQDRPAMTWLREYMASPEAAATPGPAHFEKGAYKEASVYIVPNRPWVPKGEEATITVDATMRTKTIASVELDSCDANYAPVKQLQAWSGEGPYVYAFTPTKSNQKIYFHAKVTCTDGTVYERVGSVRTHVARKPYRALEIPGIVECENFDSGIDGITFHDSDKVNQGDKNYRTTATAGGVDFVKIANGGYGIGYLEAGEWLEYTINVKEAGKYKLEMIASNGDDEDGEIELYRMDPDGSKKSMVIVKIGSTDGPNDYSTFGKAFRTNVQLEEGEQVFRLVVNKGHGNLDKMNFICTKPAGIFDDEIDEADEPAIYYNLQGVEIANPQPGQLYIRVQGDKRDK
ncbi:MAG: endo-1,4-beta-xylanase, partial [Muribaculaceae bacterium]|nr:endo-1,4-beta-xylanase [Muribaculaceae bacterium]